VAPCLWRTPITFASSTTWEEGRPPTGPTRIKRGVFQAVPVVLGRLALVEDSDPPVLAGDLHPAGKAHRVAVFDRRADPGVQAETRAGLAPVAFSRRDDPGTQVVAWDLPVRVVVFGPPVNLVVVWRPAVLVVSLEDPAVPEARPQEHPAGREDPALGDPVVRVASSPACLDCLAATMTTTRTQSSRPRPW
jgi:hypothetical protein